MLDFELFRFEKEKKLFAFDRKNGIVVDFSSELMYNDLEFGDFSQCENSVKE